MANPFTTTVKAAIHRLRAKLGDPPVIHTVAQAGLPDLRPAMHLPALPHRFRPRRRRRSARLRLTALYGVLSVLSGAVLVAGVYTWQLSIASVQPAVPAPPAASPQQPPLAQAQARIQQLQYQVNALSDRMNAITPHSLLVGLVIGLGIMASSYRPSWAGWSQGVPCGRCG